MCHQQECVCVYWCCGYHDCTCEQVNEPPVQRALNLEFDGAHADIVAEHPVVVPPVSPAQAAKQYYQLMMQQHGPEAMIMLQEAARYLIGIAPSRVGSH